MEHGSVANLQHQARPRPGRSNENIEAVRQSVAVNPSVSYRRRSQQLNISGTTLRRILKQDLHMFPYKVQLTQRLLETDKPRRLAYANNVNRYSGRVISKKGDIDWPPRSPDLTAPDFFLWGFLKSKIYANKPKTIEELKNNIRAEIAAISPETLANTMANAEKRAHFCLSNKGGHLIDVVFRN
jgi:hypothetical protein